MARSRNAFEKSSGGSSRQTPPPAQRAHEDVDEDDQAVAFVPVFDARRPGAVRCRRRAPPRDPSSAVRPQPPAQPSGIGSPRAFATRLSPPPPRSTPYRARPGSVVRPVPRSRSGCWSAAAPSPPKGRQHLAGSLAVDEEDRGQTPLRRPQLEYSPRRATWLAFRARDTGQAMLATPARSGAPGGPPSPWDLARSRTAVEGHDHADRGRGPSREPRGRPV